MSTVTYGPSRPGDLAARVVRTDRARDELGWVPTIGFEEGMRRTYEWYVSLGQTTAAPRSENA